MDNPSVLDYPKYMQKLEPYLLQPILESLNSKLHAHEEFRSLITCGGGALLILEVIDRQTRDVDVVSPVIDALLADLAKKVGQEFGLEPGWLNNGPASLSRDLEVGWEGRVQEIYKGSHLTIFTLSNRDLLASKLYAYCDRDEDDLSDILKMKPTITEVESLKPWVLERDASVYWPPRVQKCFKILLERLSYEKI